MINYLIWLQDYGVNEPQFKEAIKKATTEELEKALKTVYQVTRQRRIVAELNRRNKQ